MLEVQVKVALCPTRMAVGCALSVMVGAGGGGGDELGAAAEPPQPRRTAKYESKKRVGQSLRPKQLFMAVFGREKMIQSCFWNSVGPHA